MDITTISQLIGRLGFPVVACIALCWLGNTTLKANTDAINGVTAAVKENTTTTAQLVQLLTKQLDDGGDKAA